MGMDPAELSFKLGNWRPIDLADIERMAAALDISAADLVTEPQPERARTVRGLRDRIGRESTEWMHWLDGLQSTLERVYREESGKVIHLQRRMPIVGNIAAGQPILAEENFDGEVVFDPERHFLLRVHGSSMVDAGIYDGDMVHVLKTVAGEQRVDLNLGVHSYWWRISASHADVVKSPAVWSEVARFANQP